MTFIPPTLLFAPVFISSLFRLYFVFCFLLFCVLFCPVFITFFSVVLLHYFVVFCYFVFFFAVCFLFIFFSFFCLSLVVFRRFSAFQHSGTFDIFVGEIGPPEGRERGGWGCGEAPPSLRRQKLSFLIVHA